MYDVYCPTHQATVLLGARSIEGLEHTDHGIDLHWRCRCGTTGTLSLRTEQESALAA